jgi:hypothetical protein
MFAASAAQVSNISEPINHVQTVPEPTNTGKVPSLTAVAPQVIPSYNGILPTHIPPSHKVRLLKRNEKL